MKNLEGNAKKNAKDYRLLNNYDNSISVGELSVKKLVKRGTMLQFLSEQEIFDAIHEEHLSSRHGGRDIVCT